MKTNLSTYLTTVILAIFIGNNLIAQSNRITYTYDDNGNRESRVLSVTDMPKGEVSFPLDEKEIKTQEDEQELAIPEAESIKIYPNPTSGMLKIVFEKFSLSSNGRCQVFNLGGTQLKEVKAILPETELNLTDLSNGVYILIIGINGSIYNYRIVKN
ncbi:MAG TPA: T9SS type A sorting domain-containing protein [Bacteroidales bacterium]|nr:T9SS type A sorting domain-containing protein [Bacteroidales bacterium]